MIFEKSIDIAAPSKIVWSVMADFERWPEWAATVTSVRLLDPGPIAVGQRVWLAQPKLPPGVWRVTEVAPGRGFVWVGGGPGARVTARHAIAPVGAGSRVTLAVEFRGVIGRVTGWLLRDLNRRYLDTEAAGLKGRSESLVSGGGFE